MWHCDCLTFHSPCLFHRFGTFPTQPYYVSFGDLNNDFLPDAFHCTWVWNDGEHFSTPKLTFLENRAPIGLQMNRSDVSPLEATMSAFIAALPQPGYVHVADFDGDFLQDIVVAVYQEPANVATTPIWFFKNRGTATSPVFNATAPDLTLTVDYPVYNLHLVDLNQDWLLDVVLGGASTMHTLAQAQPTYPVATGGDSTLNVSDATFYTLPPTSNPFSGRTLGFAAIAPAFYDVDNDGDSDMVVCSEIFNTIPLRFYRNLGMYGRPTFLKETSLPCGTLCSTTFDSPQLASADMNGDGHTDVVVLDGQGQYLTFLHDGTSKPNFTRDESINFLTHLTVDRNLRYVVVDMTNDGMERAESKVLRVCRHVVGTVTYGASLFQVRPTSLGSRSAQAVRLCYTKTLARPHRGMWSHSRSPSLPLPKMQPSTCWT